MKSSRAFLKSACLVLIPLALALVCWEMRPFPNMLMHKVVGMRPLNVAQRVNLQTAAMELNGVILRPHEQFSFNRVVGPRTDTRGYMQAPSFLGIDSPQTFGGGICLLSSCVYQLALENGLQIDERIAHLRTIKTVPPGLDATVWYGKADLKFTNTLDTPIQLKAYADGNDLKVEFWGEKESLMRSPHMKFGKPAVKRHEIRRNGESLLVEVFYRSKAGDKLITRDLYRLPVHHEPIRLLAQQQAR